MRTGPEDGDGERFRLLGILREYAAELDGRVPHPEELEQAVRIPEALAST
jgi:hypothetical protein